MLATMLGIFAAGGAGGSTAITYQATASNISSNDDDGDNCTGELLYNTSGAVNKIREDWLTGFANISLTPWASGTPDAGWYVRVKYVSGAAVYTSGSGLNSWLALSSNRNWLFAFQDAGEAEAVGTYSVEISDDGGSTTHDGPNNFTVTLHINAP